MKNSPPQRAITKDQAINLNSGSGHALLSGGRNSGSIKLSACSSKSSGAIFVSNTAGPKGPDQQIARAHSPIHEAPSSWLHFRADLVAARALGGRGNCVFAPAANLCRSCSCSRSCQSQHIYWPHHALEQANQSSTDLIRG